MGNKSKKIYVFIGISLIYLFVSINLLNKLQLQNTLIQMIPPLENKYKLENGILNFKKINIVIFFSINYFCILYLYFFKNRKIYFISICSLLFILKFYAENFNILNINEKFDYRFFNFISDPGVNGIYTDLWMHESWIYALQKFSIISIFFIFVFYIIIFIITKKIFIDKKN